MPVFREPNDNGGTIVRGIHIGRLRQAVDAWRTYAGLSPLFTYEAATGLVQASHVNGIISAWNGSRAVIGLPAFTYSVVPVPAAFVIIDDDHIQQPRNAVK